MEKDIYQTRYLAHQERKKKLLAGEIKDIPFVEYNEDDIYSLNKIMRNRRSRRLFNGKIDNLEFELILEAISYTPSSCNRKAIEVVESKKGIETLIGGKGWVEKADKVLFLYANMSAYKSPNEIDFMPYLDAGFIAQNVYLICEALNIKCCFINPNHSGKEIERDGYRFCGAIAIGK